MFDFLSHASLNKIIVPEPSDWLVLNSLSFVDKAMPLMNKYERVYLLLDNDEAGKTVTKKLLSISPCYQDLSHYYKESKDVNEQLMKEKRIAQAQSLLPKQSKIRGHHI